MSIDINNKKTKKIRAPRGAKGLLTMKDLFGTVCDKIDTNDVHGRFINATPKEPVWRVSQALLRRLADLGIKNPYFDFVTYDDVDIGIKVGVVCPIKGTTKHVLIKTHILNINELKMKPLHDDIVKAVASEIKANRIH